MPAAPTKPFPRRGTSIVQARTPATTQAATATTRLILLDFTSSASCLIDSGVGTSRAVPMYGDHDDPPDCPVGPRDDCGRRMFDRAAAATNPTTCADWRSMSETAQTDLAT